MGYDIDELLDFISDNNVVALYLFEGLPPVAALPVKSDDPEVPTALVHTVEGTKLTHDELKTMMAEIGVVLYGNGIGESRYSSRGLDFDVYLFVVEERITLELRRRGA
jgi:hypothetical protein